MPLLSDFSSPSVAQQAFAGGYSEKGTPLLTLEELEAYSQGRGSRSERRYRCPFCGAHEQAFHVNVETGTFNCKRSSCAVKGCLREFWSDKPQSHFKGRGTVRGRGSSAFTLSPEKPFVPTEGGNWRELWDASFELDAPESGPGRDYLSGRGIALDGAQRAGVHFSRNWAPSADGKPYTGGAAVLFPLTNRAGELVAVGSRYLRPWTSPEGDTIKARTGGDSIEGVFRVPGTDGLDPLESEQPVLVEGPFDALALATCGAPSLAMNGVNCPAWLPKTLAFKAPFLAPDGDEGGTKALKAWKRDIGPFAPRLRLLHVADELRIKDFGECLQNDGPEVLTSWLTGAGVLLDAEEEAPLPKSWRERDDAYWERVAGSVSPGAVTICAVLQSFAPLFDLARRGALPASDCRAVIDGHPLVFENVAGVLLAIETDWTERARSCNASMRDLTTEETAALDRAGQLLEWLCAAQDGDMWLDLEALADESHEAAEQRAKECRATKAHEGTV